MIFSRNVSSNALLWMRGLPFYCSCGLYSRGWNCRINNRGRDLYTAKAHAVRKCCKVIKVLLRNNEKVFSTQCRTKVTNSTPPSRKWKGGRPAEPALCLSPCHYTWLHPVIKIDRPIDRVYFVIKKETQTICMMSTWKPWSDLPIIESEDR